MRRVLRFGLLVLLVTGCGGPGSATGDAPAAVVETIEVEYYYACGNEVLQLPDGRRFHPFIDQDRVDPSGYEGATGHAVLLAAPSGSIDLAVVEPGPGDDTGTLVIYDDGTARFESDSGIVAWLTADEVAYNWVC